MALTEQLGLISVSLVSAIVILFLLFTVGWLVVTLAEAAIVKSVLDIDDNKSSSFGRALRQGWTLLAHYVAIDAVVFFPLFVVALLTMISGMIAVFGMAALSFQDVGTGTLLTPVGLGLLCMIPLMCLMVPMGILTTLYRTWSFRDTAVCGTGIREAVRHTWVVVKQNPSAIIMFTAVVWAIQIGMRYVVDLVLDLITLPILTVIAAPGLLSMVNGTAVPTVQNILAMLLSLGISIIVVIPRSIVYAFIGTLWTLAYREMALSSEQLVVSSQGD